LRRTALRGEPYRPRPAERLREPSEHHEVGVKLDAREAANADRGESIVVLQAAELALDSATATVEVTPRLRVARDAGEQPAAECEREGCLVLLRPRSGMIGSQPRSSHSA